MAIMRFEASRAVEPNDWVKAPTCSFHPSRSTVVKICSCVRLHPSTRSPAPIRSAIAIARSSATQHITLE